MNGSSLEEYASRAVHFANNIDRSNYRSVVDEGEFTYKCNTKIGETILVTRDEYVVSYKHMVKRISLYQQERKTNCYIPRRFIGRI